MFILQYELTKQVENTSQFNKDFIKNYNEDTDERYFLKVNIFKITRPSKCFTIFTRKNKN